MKKRYLTKSRFKLARECPTKLFYIGKKDRFEDKSLDDPFLKALAFGGFQVGELAQMYHPGGHLIETLDYQKAIDQTDELLKQENVVIYEAALAHENLFVRVDVLVKKGDRIKLIEVKSKSFDPNEEYPFYDKRALKKDIFKLKDKWKPYLEDVAFQTYVARLAKPNLTFTPFLMMADKSKTATVSGLNQRFLLNEAGGRTSVQIKEGTTLEDLGEEILCKINVSEPVNVVHEGDDGSSYSEIVKTYSDAYVKDSKITPSIGGHCKSCQFKSDSKEMSGFHSCWKEATALSEKDLEGPFVFDVWNFRKSKKLIEDGIYLMRDITDSDVTIKESEKPGFSSSERQWKQIELNASGSKDPYIDYDGLLDEISSWTYPLHFIDFETTMVVLPFNEGRRPYEQMAFQFSHHQVEKNGEITHKGQYLNTKVGAFPNFDFLRALKKELDQDNGTILRFAAHENTVLCQIYDQLEKSEEPDKTELQDWIKTITTSKGDTREKWDGERSMVDMCELVKSFYYHPLTNGSNSIKKVLPASLFQSDLIKEKYSKPIYGSNEEIKSLNFQNWSWVQFDSNNEIIDPYKLLPSVFEGIATETLDLLVSNDEIADGGAAMMAYAKMQFTEMTDIERKAIEESLLKYCELDTLAMVMIFEHWVEVTGKTLKSVA